MGKRVLLAVNERARRGRGARARVAAALRRCGHAVLEAALDGPDALARAIRERRDEVDAAVIGGGDGTLLHAVDALVETRLPLAILPLGTFNELARTLGVPQDPDAVARLIDDGVPLPLDVGVVNGHRYLNEASIGLSTRVTELQTDEVKGRLGMLAIPITTLRALRAMRPLHLIVEDEQGNERAVRAVQLTVANSYRFGGVVENPDASLEDGKAWLYSIDVRGPLEMARVLGAVALRRLRRSPEVLAVRGSRFRVRSRSGAAHHVYADSERATRLPAEFTIEHGALTVLVAERALPNIR